MQNKLTFREIAAQFINPTVIGTGFIKKPYLLMPLLPIACFLFFGFQIMLERFRAGANANAAAIPVVCALLGIACAFSTAAVMFAFSRLEKDTTSYKDFLVYSCTAFSGTAVYELLGLLLNLSSFTATSQNFGITGFIWLLIPFLAIARYIFEEKTYQMLLCVTCAGSVPMVMWGILTLYGGTGL
ncbi:MAG: hypothetical protein DBX47_02215 [Clostridiales bacterium]|nr:MAG: hypothetical protein DBX47_02215 [Clostridiales bacterium]